MSDSSINHSQNHVHGSVKSYLYGFILSLVLTFAAYVPVAVHQDANHAFLSHDLLIPFVLVLAFVQLIVQLWFFLHLGREPQPRWNGFFFLSTAAIVLMVVLASIWIMDNLNYNMTPHQVDQNVMEKENIYK